MSDNRTENELPMVIPPHSTFRLVRSDADAPDWAADVGRVFRSRQNGLDVIWLVNEQGKYEQTTDREFLLEYFEPMQVSAEKLSADAFRCYARGKREHQGRP